MSNDHHKTVWSSEEGDQRRKNENTTSTKSLPQQQQTIYLHRESSGRGGKAVSLVKECGSGGTIKDGVIEIQGEHREKIADVLRKLGYKVKVAGG
jgi:translation initiation factor 1